MQMRNHYNSDEILHNVTSNNSFVIFSLGNFAQIQQITNDHHQKSVFLQNKATQDMSLRKNDGSNDQD